MPLGRAYATLTFWIAHALPNHAQGVIQVTESASSSMAILFGLAVFAIIVAVGWRSVQNRRILRMKDASGQETIVVAGEEDEITSVDTITETVRP